MVSQLQDISVEKDQSSVLIAAIDKYLSWRRNKKVSDGRNFPVGVLTRLRHSGSSGINRANSLKKFLQQGSDSPVSILQKHFINRSRIDNHSLDTYLLEHIVFNKKLFLINIDISTLTTKVERDFLRKKIMTIKVLSSIQTAYEIGRLFEGDTEEKNHLYKACHYYLIAARQKMNTAKVKLEHLLPKINDLNLLYDFVRIQIEVFHDTSSAVEWYKKAIEGKRQVLKSTTQLELGDNPQFMYALAESYKNGSKAKEDYLRMVFFYEKSAQAGHGKAALYLGLLYLVHNEYEKQDLKKAWHYLFMAAKLNVYDAFPSLDSLAINMDAGKQFELANQYQRINNINQALYWYQQASEGGNTEAGQKMKMLSSNRNFSSVDLFSDVGSKLDNQKNQLDSWLLELEKNLTR